MTRVSVHVRVVKYYIVCDVQSVRHGDRDGRDTGAKNTIKL